MRHGNRPAMTVVRRLAFAMALIATMQHSLAGNSMEDPNIDMDYCVEECVDFIAADKSGMFGRDRFCVASEDAFLLNEGSLSLHADKFWPKSNREYKRCWKKDERTIRRMIDMCHHEVMVRYKCDATEVSDLDNEALVRRCAGRCAKLEYSRYMASKSFMMSMFPSEKTFVKNNQRDTQTQNTGFWQDEEYSACFDSAEVTNEALMRCYSRVKETAEIPEENIRKYDDLTQEEVNQFIDECAKECFSKEMNVQMNWGTTYSGLCVGSPGDRQDAKKKILGMDNSDDTEEALTPEEEAKVTKEVRKSLRERYIRSNSGESGPLGYKEYFKGDSRKKCIHEDVRVEAVTRCAERIQKNCNRLGNRIFASQSA